MLSVAPWALNVSFFMDFANKNPAQLGYRMPAEWEPHAATWLSWPRREGISFPESFYRIPTNEPWCRDHGPIFLTRDVDPKLAVVDWDYNAWGNKYPPFALDDA